MKTCPYCKEEVHDGAVKCRYCQSSLETLLPTAKDSKDDRHVTYVVDTDLIRFAKFSIAVLAVFLVVGAYFFGFKLQDSVDRVYALQKEVEKASDELKTSQMELRRSKSAVVTLKTEVESVLAQAKLVLDEIAKQRDTAAALVSSIRELTAPQEQQLVQIRSTEPEKARETGKLWAKGATIRVGFIDGTTEQQNLAKRAAKEWTQYANINFEFVTEGNTDVRVAFNPQAGSWSYLGTDALAISQSQPTMNFAWMQPQTLLHEFGHVLGLIEEHKNPNADIQWNVEAVRTSLSGPPNYWSDSQIDHTIFNKFSKDQVGEYREFDPESIMILAFPPGFTGGVLISGATELSESDKRLVQRWYP